MSAESILLQKAAGDVSDYVIRKVPKTNRQFYRVLHQLADRATPAVRRQFLRAVEAMKGTTKIKALQAALESGNERAVFTALGIDQLDKHLAPLVGELRGAYNQAAIAAGQLLPKSIQAQYVFDIFNPRAADYARTKAAQLVMQVGDATKEGIRRIITEGVAQGLTVQQQSTRIKDLLALTPRQASAVDNYKAMLVSEGRKPAQIKRMTDRYRQRQLRYRATRIARTETINAVNAGQEEAWAQALDQGLLGPDVRKAWQITPDDVTCKLCLSVPELNPDGVPIGMSFDTPLGPVMGPTLHPHCRCAMVLNT
jgi:hypothetical protein